jgi:bacterial/archaeal transporter family protein
MKPWLHNALICMFLYGFWGFFPKLASRTLDPRSIAYYEFVGILIALLLGLLFNRDRLAGNPTGIAWAIAAGFVGMIGSFFFLKALSQGKASIVVVFTSLYPLFVLLFAFLFLKETITTRQGVGIACAVLAVALLAG